MSDLESFVFSACNCRFNLMFSLIVQCVFLNALCLKNRLTQSLTPTPKRKFANPSICNLQRFAPVATNTALPVSHLAALMLRAGPRITQPPVPRVAWTLFRQRKTLAGIGIGGVVGWQEVCGQGNLKKPKLHKSSLCDSEKHAKLLHGCGSKNGTQNGTLANGSMDEILRSPGLILTHTHMGPWRNGSVHVTSHHGRV